MRRILLVDDDEDLRSLWALVLQKRGGFEVCIAGGGEEGLEIARKQQPDVIVLDLNMPGMDGRQLRDALDAHPATHEIPIILATSSDPEETMDIDCLAVIQKPVEPQQLVGRVQDILATRAAREGQAAPSLIEERGRRRILLIDDDRNFRDVVHAVASSLDLEVYAVPSLSGARHFAAREHFDLLVVDGLLPDGTGIDFISWVRGHGSDVPILYVSGVFRDEETIQALRCNERVNQTLSKPLSPEALAMEIRMLLEVSSGPDEGLEEEMAQRRRAFELRLLGQIDEVGLRVLDARNHPRDDARLELAQRSAHTLKGGAGSYGFLGVCRAMGTIEALLGLLRDRLRANEADDGERIVWDALGLTLQQTRQLEELRRPGTPTTSTC